MYYIDEIFKIYYEKKGNGKKNILILPGWGNNRKTFTNIINYLSKENTVYIIDYPGFGNSFIYKENLTIYDYALSINKFIKELKLDNLTIIAHSFGGRIASILTGHYNLKLDNLILIDIAGIKEKRFIKNTLYKLKKHLINLLPLKQRLYLKNKLYQKYASSDYKDLPDNMKQTFKNIVNEDLTKYMKNITTETLIIWGELDTITPLKDAYKINKLIKNSYLITIKGAHHFSYLDYPTLTINILDNLINKKHD